MVKGGTPLRAANHASGKHRPLFIAVITIGGNQAVYRTVHGQVANCRTARIREQRQTGVALAAVSTPRVNLPAAVAAVRIDVITIFTANVQRDGFTTTIKGARESLAAVTVAILANAEDTSASEVDIAGESDSLAVFRVNFDIKYQSSVAIRIVRIGIEIERQRIGGKILR